MSAANAGSPPPTGSNARFLLGTLLFIAGFGAPALIPLVVRSGLSSGIKTALSGVLAFGLPEVAMLAAAAVMGRAGFDRWKTLLARVFRKYGPADTVGPLRYRIGLFLFFAPLALGWLSPYAGSHLPGLEAYPARWAIAGDVVLLCSLFVLGGDFWDKLQSLFDQNKRVTATRPAGSSPATGSRS